MSYPPPTCDDREGIALLRAALDRAGFTDEATAASLGLDNLFGRDPGDIPAYLRRLDRGPLATLVELFLLALPVETGRAEAALRPLGLERAERMNVLRAGGGEAEAIVELVPVGDLVICSDQARLHAHAPDHVLGVARPTRVLGSLTVRRPVESALDVGCGSGFQAFEAARHAGRVVGVDINPRALRFADFNAVLNGLENVETREGSLFEPVAGERFGLVVCNPPYIISPETAYAFRDSGLPGDSFCEALVRDLPAYLEEGAFGHALVCWVHGEREDWSAPLRRWVDGGGCDALLFRYRCWTPLDYAAGWNRPLRGDPEVYAAAIDRWLAYYRELGIERISWGGVVLRRRSGGRNWVWTHEPSADRINPASDHLLRLFAAQDLLGGLAGDGGLAGRSVELADDHVLEQRLRLAGGDGALGPTMLRQRGGLMFQVELDGPTVALLSQLKRGRTLGEAIERVSPGAGEEFVASAVAGATRLLELGFLVAAEEGR
jgi:methylase of polypeptide subunit release factors